MPLMKTEKEALIELINNTLKRCIYTDDLYDGYESACHDIKERIKAMPEEEPQWLDSPTELGIYIVKGVFQEGYTAVNIFIPDGLAGAGLSVEMIGRDGWYKLEKFIAGFKATRWQKVEPK